MEKPHNTRSIKCCENYPAHIIPLSTSPKCNNFLKHKRNFSHLYFLSSEVWACTSILHSKWEAGKLLYFLLEAVNLGGWWGEPRILIFLPLGSLTGSSFLAINGGKLSLGCPGKMRIQSTDLKNQKIQFPEGSMHIFSWSAKLFCTYSKRRKLSSLSSLPGNGSWDIPKPTEEMCVYFLALCSFLHHLTFITILTKLKWRHKMWASGRLEKMSYTLLQFTAN